jgi:alkanesulfonate monooxygenase SsuD/methylene tetrahydromethanopterin reductase-like flavin-dependent oxidoreductase (luciferase family)
LHVAATGPRLTRAAAAMGDGVILLRGAAPDLIGGGLDLVDEGLAAAGRRSGDVAVTAWVYVGIDDDPARAYDQVRARVAAVLRLIDPATVDGVEREVVERVRRAYDMSAHAGSMPAHAALVPQDLLDRYAIAGDAATVRSRLDTLVRDPRIDRVVVSPQIGAPGVPITGEFIDRFGEAVLPGLGPV